MTTKKPARRKAAHAAPDDPDRTAPPTSADPESHDVELHDGQIAVVHLDAARRFVGVAALDAPAGHAPGGLVTIDGRVCSHVGPYHPDDPEHDDLRGWPAYAEI